MVSRRVSNYIVSVSVAFGGVFATDLLEAAPKIPSWIQAAGVIVPIAMVVVVAILNRNDKANFRKLFSSGSTWLLVSIGSTSLANGVHTVETQGIGPIPDLLFFVFVLISASAQLVKSGIEGEGSNRGQGS